MDPINSMDIVLPPLSLSMPLSEYGIKIPPLVAHRGYVGKYPENTLLSLHQALLHGARFVEFDIQFCSDGTPVLFHDAELERTTGQSGLITDFTVSQVRRFQACERRRFGRRFVNTGVSVPTLRDAVYLLKNFPYAQAFVEIKNESMEKFGIERVVKNTVRDLGPGLDQCIVISYNSLAIRTARAMGAKQIGWVIDQWDNDARSIATGLAPDYLFLNYHKIPKTLDVLWPGPWKWVLYDINDPELAIYLTFIGADLIETSQIGTMLQHPLLRKEGWFAETTRAA